MSAIYSRLLTTKARLACYSKESRETRNVEKFVAEAKQTDRYKELKERYDYISLFIVVLSNIINNCYFIVSFNSFYVLSIRLYFVHV